MQTYNYYVIITNKKGHDTMKKIIDLNLYKEYRLDQDFKDIVAIEKNLEYIFLLDGIKTVLGPTRFVRETEEYKFELNIKAKTGLYLLKSQNMKFDIEVEEIMYKKDNNNIILEYKISSDEENFKIELLIKDDNNE